MKALTYYKLRENEIEEGTMLKTKLLRIPEKEYAVPYSVLLRRVNDDLKSDEGQGVGTIISAKDEEMLVRWLNRRKKMFCPVTEEEFLSRCCSFHQRWKGG